MDLEKKKKKLATQICKPDDLNPPEPVFPSSSSHPSEDCVVVFSRHLPASIRGRALEVTGLEALGHCRQHGRHRGVVVQWVETST